MISLSLGTREGERNSLPHENVTSACDMPPITYVACVASIFTHVCCRTMRVLFAIRPERKEQLKQKQSI